MNKIREIPQHPGLIVTHTDSPEVFLWNMDTQPSRSREKVGGDVWGGRVGCRANADEREQGEGGGEGSRSGGRGRDIALLLAHCAWTVCLAVSIPCLGNALPPPPLTCRPQPPPDLSGHHQGQQCSPPSFPLPSQGTTKASNAPNTPDLRLVGHEEEAVFPLAASDAAPFIASGGSDKMVG